MKKLCKVLMIATLAFILTGCIKMRTTVIIKDENTASMEMEMLYSKEFLDEYDMSVDNLKDQFLTGDYKGIKVKEIEETIDGKKYLGIVAPAPKKDVDKILDELTVKEVDGKKEYTLALTEDSLGENMDPDKIAGAQYSLEEMKKAGVELTMTVQMPGKITDATVGKVDGNTIVVDLFDVTSDTGVVATVTSIENSSNNAMYLYAAIGVGVLAIIAVAGILIVKKRKNRMHDVITINEPVEITSERVAPINEETNTSDTTSTDGDPTKEESDN